MMTLVGWVVFFLAGMLFQKYRPQNVGWAKELFKKKGVPK